MTKLKFNKLFFGMIILTIVLSSCKKPKDDSDTPDAEIPQKVYVLNEGSFGNGNASVGIYDIANGKMYNNLFKETNDRPIGDVLQSMTLINGKAYFVVNNSNKIEVTESYPLTSTAVIHGLSLPRYIVAVNGNKAYVSEYVSFVAANGRISIVNLNTNTITGTINVGLLPEKMVLLNGKVYVCNSGGNTISVINTSNDMVENNITVTDGPNSILKDVNEKLWVSCGGILQYDSNPPDYIDEVNSTTGALVRIDPSSGTVEATLPFSDVTGSPSKLCINGAKDKLFYSYLNGIYTQDISSGTLSSTPIITRSYYGLGVDPVSNYVYIGTYGFSSNQKMIRYHQNGTAIDSNTVGIGPNGFVFSY
jgi:YVTN family beta-propeller protein